MQREKIKIRLISILLCLLFILFPIISILMIYHITVTDTLSQMGSDSFGKSVCYLSVNQDQNDSLSLIQEIRKEKCSLALTTSETLNKTTTLKYIYFNHRYANIPMKKGRFFKKSDFKEGNKVAVIGKAQQKNIIRHDHKEWIDVLGDEYKVIGVIGYAGETVYDSNILINMLGTNQQESHFYILDDYSDEKVSDYAGKIKDQVKEKGLSVEILSAQESYSEEVIPKMISARWFVGLLMAFLICMILMSTQWIRAQTREICIRRLVGATDIQIVGVVLKRYLWMISLSFLVGMGYCLFFYRAYMYMFVIGYIICILAMMIVICNGIKQALQASIEEEIRR